ncbi:MAG: transposase [Candidatus Buchananbacteria bacterium]|nr:transposase [Candidatus Buchananbacteria bacterium]
MTEILHNPTNPTELGTLRDTSVASQAPKAKFDDPSRVGQKKEQKRTREKKDAFVAACKGPVKSIVTMCRKVGIHRDTFYAWRRADPEFVKRIHNSRDVFLTELEASLKARDKSDT